VISGIDTTEAVVVAGQRAEQGQRVFSVAYDNRAGCEQAPASCLGVPFYNWGPSYAELVQRVQSGEWEQSWDFIQPNFAEDSIVGFEFGEGLTADAAAQLEDFIGRMQAYAEDPMNADTVFLWQGPLYLQDGTTLLADEGEAVDLLEIWYLPQLLQGMEGASNSE
jgi:simple sugar transport system substrate-binding protein